MLKYRVIIPMVFEEEAHHDATIGTHHAQEGRSEVEVKPTGTQVGEVCQMAFEGTLPDILEVLMKEWEDDEFAVEALHQAFIDGHTEVI